LGSFFQKKKFVFLLKKLLSSEKLPLHLLQVVAFDSRDGTVRQFTNKRDHREAMNVDIEDVDSDSDFDDLEEDIDSEMEWCNFDHSMEERRKLLTAFLAKMFLDESLQESHKRRRKQRKSIDDRLAPWLFIEKWSDAVFERQFRMDRDYFFKLLKRIINVYEGPRGSGLENYKYSCQQGDNSTGCHILIEIKLCITLRLLAGASYLDMIWYGVDLGYVEAIFLDLIKLIDKALPDHEIFDCNAETDFKKMAHEWSHIMEDGRGFDLMKGTILAGDGLVVQIQAVAEEDRRGLDINAFRNRKGYTGIIVQAFCDAFCMIRYFEIAWPGATPDITAYKQTELFLMWVRGIIPSCYHMVLDDAYSSIGGNQHLTPFNRRQLRSANDKCERLYEQMKTFNNILSSQRITIERCFGMMVRKWGILWRPLCYSLHNNTLIVKICAKLHNWCIMSWKEKGSRRQEVRDIRDEYGTFKDVGVFYGWEDKLLWSDDSADIPNDEDVAEMMGNLRSPSGTAASRVSDRRTKLMENMYNCGFQYSVKQDNDFTLNMK
jgi:hypothetical protein